MGGAVGQGSIEAFVRRHLQAAYGVALRLSPTPADAQALAAESMTRTVRALDHIQTRGDAWEWVCKIMLNVWRSRPHRKGDALVDELAALDDEKGAIRLSSADVDLGQPLPEGYFETFMAGLKEDRAKQAAVAQKAASRAAVVARIKDFFRSIAAILLIAATVAGIWVFMPDFFPSIWRIAVDFSQSSNDD